ncbi:MAG TPA: LamG-like jellyroll fold domain-containing protein [Urbifossiella sp.]|nr:LamG-like jellyroll fold domain-containing protein [Urbifossiella sp.]
MHRFPAALALLISGLLVATTRADEAAVHKAVTLYASFDEAVKGDLGGDLTAGTRFPHPTEKGQFVFEKTVESAVVRIAKEKGIAGGALESVAVSPKNGRLYFPVKGNLAYKKNGWSGSVSVWCNTDPNRLITAKFCDPVQITQKGYDNGALWFDFNDAKPRDLRFGAFTARSDGKKAVPESDPKAPLIRAPRIDWKAGEWHHVALTFQNLDTGKTDAVTTLYIDGKRIGTVKGEAIAMGWEPEKASVFLAISYIGLMDEFALFDRALTAQDVALLHKKPDLLTVLKKR